MREVAADCVSYAFSMILWIQGPTGAHPSALNGYDSLEHCRKAIPTVVESYRNLAHKRIEAISKGRSPSKAKRPLEQAVDLLAAECIKVEK